MTGSMVAVKDPVVNAPQIGSFSRNVLPQTLQNVTVDLSIDSFALVNEFSMYNMSDVAKKKKTFSRHSHVKIAGYIIHVITNFTTCETNSAMSLGTLTHKDNC